MIHKRAIKNGNKAINHYILGHRKIQVPAIGTFDTVYDVRLSDSLVFEVKCHETHFSRLDNLDFSLHLSCLINCYLILHLILQQ